MNLNRDSMKERFWNSLETKVGVDYEIAVLSLAHKHVKSGRRNHFGLCLVPIQKTKLSSEIGVILGWGKTEGEAMEHLKQRATFILRVIS